MQHVHWIVNRDDADSSRAGIFIRDIRHPFIVIHWTMLHISLNHNENMLYPGIWKDLPCGSSQPLYSFIHSKWHWYQLDYHIFWIRLLDPKRESNWFSVWTSRVLKICKMSILESIDFNFYLFQWRTVGFWHPGKEVKLAPLYLTPPKKKIK